MALRETILKERLLQYKRRYYLNKLIRGILLSLLILSSLYILFNIFEYQGRFGKLLRAGLFFTYVGTAVFVFIREIFLPLYRWLNADRRLSDREAALQIGDHFPEVRDKLINTLQLSSLNESENDLIQAGIEQKIKNISTVSFFKAVNLKSNLRYLKYLGIPTFILLLILLFSPSLFSESTERIIRYNEALLPAAPFRFILKSDLSVFKGEDYKVLVKIEGKSLPSEVMLSSDDRVFQMKKSGADTYLLIFKNVNKSFDFRFESAGYASESYTVSVAERPGLLQTEAYVTYPSYIGRKSEKISDASILSVPEGSRVVWSLKTKNTTDIAVRSDKGGSVSAKKTATGTFQFEDKISEPRELTVSFKNGSGTAQNPFKIRVDAVRDRYPSITVNPAEDSLTRRRIVLGGSVSDDYGISALKLFYRTDRNKNDSKTPFKSIPLILAGGQLPEQVFLQEWDLKSLLLRAGDRLEYYLEVWDNDGIHGPKSSKTETFVYRIPDPALLRKEQEKLDKYIENRINTSSGQARELSKSLKKLNDDLKLKKDLNEDDRNRIKDLLRRREELKKQLNELQKTQDQRVEDLKQQSPTSKSADKAEQLRKLMEELSQRDSDKLYEELQKLLNEFKNPDELRQLLEKIERGEKNLPSDLERTLELFKEIMFDRALEQAAQDLKELSEKQKELAEKTEQQSESKENLLQEQKNLSEEFKEAQEALEKLKEQSKELDGKPDLENLSELEKEIREEQQKSMENLKDGNDSKASQNQKDAGNKMEQLAQQLEQMQDSSEEEANQENMGDLRAILENLLKISFDQENLMKELRNTSKSDPAYTGLVKKQLLLKEDTQATQDSLNTLAQKVPQIARFVTEEMSNMSDYMTQSSDALRKGASEIAAGKQQSAMTSVNNLALMLSDVLEQMQNASANAKAGGKKKGKKGNASSLSQMQQNMNKEMQELQKSGKTGRELSEKLAELAAQQELIRKALLEMRMEQGGGSQNSKELKKLYEMMEKTEEDLVNKKLSAETVLRQQEILTRLLESEKAAREQDTEEKREAKQPSPNIRPISPADIKFIKKSASSIEFLRRAAPSLTPYYKQKAGEYFHAPSQ